jgi:hypothetical protein
MSPIRSKAVDNAASCPVCGPDHHDKLVGYNLIHSHGATYVIKCRECGLEMPLHKWNYRPTEDKLRVEVERLTKELDEAQLMANHYRTEADNLVAQRNSANEDNTRLAKELSETQEILDFVRKEILNKCKNSYIFAHLRKVVEKLTSWKGVIR